MGRAEEESKLVASDISGRLAGRCSSYAEMGLQLRLKCSRKLSEAVRALFVVVDVIEGKGECDKALPTEAKHDVPCNL